MVSIGCHRGPIFNGEVQTSDNGDLARSDGRVTQGRGLQSLTGRPPHIGRGPLFGVKEERGPAR